MSLAILQKLKKGGLILVIGLVLIVLVFLLYYFKPWQKKPASLPSLLPSNVQESEPSGFLANLSVLKEMAIEESKVINYDQINTQLQTVTFSTTKNLEEVYRALIEELKANQWQIKNGSLEDHFLYAEKGTEALNITFVQKEGVWKITVGYLTKP